jgi:hypothetical protein
MGHTWIYERLHLCQSILDPTLCDVGLVTPNRVSVGDGNERTLGTYPSLGLPIS